MFSPFKLLVAACLLVVPAFAAEPTREQIEFFEKKVRPILSEHCFSCHSEAQKKTKGGLTLDTFAGLMAGGDGGPIVVPGDPGKSRLIEAVRYQKEDFRMPPKKALPQADIDTLTAWVKDGAPWPNANEKSNRRKPGQITDEDRAWWSFKPMTRPAAPNAGEGWAKNEIDRFIAAKQHAAKLKPAPVASPTVLIRRLTFDLWGLPPTPEEITAFERESAVDASAAYEKLVDRLLASPRYGERWARHWLDLVRYADSDGYRIDDYRPNSWPYRDYVVRAFNEDKPYDRFVQEQLAGDELFPGNVEALVATGYLRHWIYEYNARDVRGQWTVILNDITDTTGDVFLGLGMQCARCHDHKFDPILQKDYFRLQAFFANILPRDDLVIATEQEKAAHAQKLKDWEAKTASLRAEIERIEAPYRAKATKSAVEKFPEDIQAMIRKPVDNRSPLEHQLAELAYRQVYYEYDRLERTLKAEDKEKVLALRRKLAEHDALKPPPLPPAFAASDVGPVAPPVTIPKRGDTPIEPGFLTLLDDKPATIAPMPQSTGRRTALARWLTRTDNPLTARVMVNRVWQQHFGTGLAANASDFGRLGEAPSHPELLDWLSTRFVDDGWSLKKLHRRIVMSATYRQSASHPDLAAGKLVDPENRLIWKGNVRRLDAEQIRDALFSVTGELDLKRIGGPGSPGTEARRSIYTKIMRNTRDPLFDVFDAPLWFNSASSRDTTTTPVQSLLLINSQFMLQRSRAMSDRLWKSEPADESRRIGQAYQLAFGRAPSADEVAAAQKFLEEQARRIDPRKSGSASAAFVSGKIPFRDGQAAEVKMASGHPGFQVPDGAQLPKENFTIEAFVYPWSVADTGAVRTIAGKWDGNTKSAGWALGVTGKQSRRKPQTMVIQLVGKKRGGSVGEEAIFSDQHIALNKPYYVAASVKLATAKEPGMVHFYLKDLSNDDEPLLTAKVPHSIVGELANNQPFTIGARGARASGGFDGLVDDVRLSDTALGVEQLLFTNEGTNKHTVGYWQFEAKPSVFRDSAGHGLDIRPGSSAATGPRDLHRQAWNDLCHVLLNASEFLYVE